MCWWAVLRVALRCTSKDSGQCGVDSGAKASEVVCNGKLRVVKGHCSDFALSSLSGGCYSGDCLGRVRFQQRTVLSQAELELYN